MEWKFPKFTSGRPPVYVMPWLWTQYWKLLYISGLPVTFNMLGYFAIKKNIYVHYISCSFVWFCEGKNLLHWGQSFLRSKKFYLNEWTLFRQIFKYDDNLVIHDFLWHRRQYYKWPSIAHNLFSRSKITFRFVSP